MIKIICVGKIKEKYLKEAINDYVKRIGKYHKIEIVEVMDSDMTRERDLIVKHIGSRDYIITLEIEGSNISSIELAEKIDKTFITNNTITFIIGGSDGLHSDIKKLSNYKLSFSKMTFPHGLFRVILLEQIYRSFKILNGESYHK
jgi:23S rRNA (pseudouridine1915-N3)-methyltransferase